MPYSYFESMMVLIKSSGLFGLASIAAGLILFVFGLFLTAVVRTGKAAVIFLICACIPLALGLAGTFLGRAQAHQAVRQTGRAINDPAVRTDLEHGYSIAWNSTYIGLACTIPLLLLGAAALIRAKPDTSGEHIYAADKPAAPGGDMNRKEILEKLARREITRDEADRLLHESDSAGGPFEAPPPRRTVAGKKNLGCLIVFISFLLFLFLLPVAGYLFYTNRRSAKLQVEKMRKKEEIEILKAQEEMFREEICEVKAEEKKGNISSEQAEKLIAELEAEIRELEGKMQNINRGTLIQEKHSCLK